nr:uncharacterized protein [Tanacetum cinerariifolium]
MVSSSCVTQITINFRYGGVFEANPVLYDYGMLKKLENVDLISMDYSQKIGLRSLKNDDGVRNCRQYALRNNGEIDIYMAHSEFSDWIARSYAKNIMTNPNMKVNDIQEAILKKYKCRVTFGQAIRGKIKALKQCETCLEDHYAKLWSYAQEIITSNSGSTCLMGVNPMPDGKTYFKCFYVCFKGIKQGWLEGCRRVIGLDRCFLKTICKGELLSAVGRDGNNQVYPIVWICLQN